MRALVTLVAAWCMLVATAPHAPVFRVSLSVSPFVETTLGTGTRFTDGTLTATSAEELQRLFVSHGANEVYARISTRQSLVRGGGDHTMNRGLDRARMAAALHLPFNPELGLFGSYGDIRCQPPPRLHRLSRHRTAPTVVVADVGRNDGRIARIRRAGGEADRCHWCDRQYLGPRQ